ncbi:hypothetical protein D9756_002290 [Leucocoprinus leucothites]|uniref:Uncharacterized protein n=1 Tax=Leucocoprinus leucothites TaxID=201217 RepID=A0A8H5GCP1_9AGAR|nr:hypothetical protein D9756_002290 [Leucoagaricus leucothites]
MPEQSRASPRSRLIQNVRRSITPKRHARSESASMLMYSTPQERQPSYSAAFRELPNPAARPTVEQIAMGLHVSRTPHLRHHPRSPSHSPPAPSLPRRPSLKKPSLASSSNASSSALHTLPLPTDASASTSTVTTSASLHITGSILSTSVSASPRLQHWPHSSASSTSSSTLSALKLRMARLLPGDRKRSASAPPSRVLASSTRSSAETLNGSMPSHAARKAVRFEES